MGIHAAPSGMQMQHIKPLPESANSMSSESACRHSNETAPDGPQVGKKKVQKRCGSDDIILRAMRQLGGDATGPEVIRKIKGEPLLLAVVQSSLNTNVRNKRKDCYWE